MFTNDRWPRAANWDKTLKTADDWNLDSVHVDDWASVGSGSTLLPGAEIGQCALVGAGSVVVGAVKPFAIVVGNPARQVGDVRAREPSPPNF